MSIDLRTKKILITGGPARLASRAYYTYVLQSLKDNKFYIGYTNDLKVRLELHKSGNVFSTKHRLPVWLVYCEICLNKYDAIAREKYFKTGFGRRFLNNRLENYLRGSRGGRIKNKD